MENEYRSALVSVVVPTYQRGYCIEQAIDSILAQTHQNLEIFVVDDGSTDDTRQRVNDRYCNDTRVFYLYQENAGVSSARNNGLKRARGQFVALLDSDDSWFPWKLELQLACLSQTPQAGMIWTDMEAIGSDGKVIAHRYLRKMYHGYNRLSVEQLFSAAYALPQISTPLAVQEQEARLYVGDIFSQMIMGNLVHTSTVLIRKERLARVKGFNEQLRFSGEDFDFHLRTCQAGPVAFVDVPSIQYAIGRPDQLTKPSYSIHMARNCLQTIAPMLTAERERITLSSDQISLKLSEVHGWIGVSALDLELTWEAREHLFKCLCYRPLQPRMVALLLLSLLPAPYAKRVRKQVSRIRQHSALSGSFSAPVPSTTGSTNG